jgi:hypothetical protein
LDHFCKAGVDQLLPELLVVAGIFETFRLLSIPVWARFGTEIAKESRLELLSAGKQLCLIGVG